MFAYEDSTGNHKSRYVFKKNNWGRGTGGKGGAPALDAKPHKKSDFVKRKPGRKASPFTMTGGAKDLPLLELEKGEGDQEYWAQAHPYGKENRPEGIAHCDLEGKRRGGEKGRVA